MTNFHGYGLLQTADEQFLYVSAYATNDSGTARKDALLRVAYPYL
jgi:hypothetical protein